ncbi:NAD(P)/FAD-dependent oxidoreductase [Flavobacterium sp. xlx-214]|uniref:NAD(P)/FAD-dependent oxidoreductase n=1 Tax=unclassified Flavobacterium TaxID=196869 RepID=UPI0013D3462D|nr:MULTISPECIES: NAD(P)/FAD-dependent oxidoreductase [unclassified Flavobacterium]MBA5792349.1 NAD(P)/FAD-dependent oxidoreductase [Flavobacterium sp. xlx-221]QMI82336.1 NAD(P)/FAD-dependent oxidoreductase [Flavobacterium sp. xlx-214]
MHIFDVIVIGGGASGFFTALNLAEQRPNLRIAILERGKEVLAKVKISGGGRCNVTHACFVPNVLTKFYPRGERELRGPFSTFCTGDVMQWFDDRGVALKIEDDGRVFPESDNSQTIIDCFLEEAQQANIKISTQTIVQNIVKADDVWQISTSKDAYSCKHLVMATGSNTKIWDLCTSFGHSIVAPVPSLFTFNTKDDRLQNLMGVSAPMVSLKVKNSTLKANGPLLITHWGLSGPAILRLSAWGARELFDKSYQFELVVNWTNDFVFDEVLDELMENKTESPKKTIAKYPQYNLTHRLWQQLVKAADISETLTWADVTKKQLVKLAEQLTQCTFAINGKSTFKEEFVTAGGIGLKEINFKTMESKLIENLYFTGEVLNIDAITGGFNFQNAWTTGFLAAQSITNKA